MTQQTTFDASKYKTTTRQQWESAAEAWHRWAPTLRSWLGPATERLLDLARVESGSRVLDVAAGAGDQTLQIASRVGPGGSVLATDISPAILAFAAAEAKRALLANVATRPMDGEHLELDDASFDVVVSRVGLIYFPDQEQALREMRRVLVPGGRVAAIVYSTPAQNGFFSAPVSVVRRHAQLGAPLPGQPGPFSLGGPGVLEEALDARRLLRRARRSASRRRSACRRRKLVCASSKSRSGRYIKCCRRSTRPVAAPRGKKSGARSANSSSKRAASWVRASSCSASARSEQPMPARAGCEAGREGHRNLQRRNREIQ